jgi:uncharacterized membrane protein SirB2
MPIDTNCPNCSSDNTQGVSIVISELRGRKVGRNEIVFIQKYTFNKKPTSGCIIAIPILLGSLLVISGIVMLVVGDQDARYTIPAFIIGLGLIAFGIMLMRGNTQLDKQKLEHAQWLKKVWICRKCGHEWTPE